MSDYITRQREERARAWEQAKALLDSAATENRDLSPEEQVTFDRINADIDHRAEVIKDLEERAAREESIRAAVKNAPEARPEERKADTDAEMIRALVRGESRSVTFDKRAVTGGSTGAPVPTSFYDQVIMKARLVGPMLETSTVLNTAGGESLQIPSINTWSTAAITGQGTAISVSEPAFNAFVTLGAFKYSFLVQLSTELLDDAGVDVMGFIADQTGNAMGYYVNDALTNGTGTVQPKGIVVAATVGGTGGTGVAGVPTYENLVDLVYSLDGAARRMPGFGWQMAGSTIAKIRQIKDGNGTYIFTPSLVQGQPDQLLGYTLHENPAIAAAATATKSIVVGHLPSYYVRAAGGLRLERSDQFAFDKDLVTFKATMRVDGNLIQTSHIKSFLGGAS